MLVVSLVVALFFLVSFLWAIKTGQYEDDYTPSVRILFEDELINNNQNTSNNGSTKV
jgi:cbb3-type cytochrome oxidase maturation protein